MKILVVNPNSSEAVSDVIMCSARKKANPSTEFVCLTNPAGTKNIDCAFGDYMSSHSHIKDCLEGIYRLMRSDHREPLNLGSDRLVTINEMIDIVSAVAGKTVRRRHDLTKPQGVRGRNSDNTRLREVLQWEPQVTLEDGLAETYHWIHGQLEAEGRIPTKAASLA